MIEARSLTRRFGGRAAVRDVSFKVEPGEVVGFLGPNGAGKTTTMRLLLGLLRPTGGSAEVDGGVGYLPEVFTAYDALSVAGYLRFICRMKGVEKAAVERSMRSAGVADLASRPVSRLSKGQRQRVGMAQALVGRPPNYVLDEPTQGLDPAQVVEARRLVRSLATSDGAAVLFSTHLPVSYTQSDAADE
jgi:ABC-2 type transport system ATP-binding protein